MGKRQCVSLERYRVMANDEQLNIFRNRKLAVNIRAVHFSKKTLAHGIGSGEWLIEHNKRCG